MSDTNPRESAQPSNHALSGTLRERFEKKAAAMGYDISKSDLAVTGYTNQDTIHLYLGWQSAAAEQGERIAELEMLTRFSPSPCGHSSQYAYTENGGKNIECLLCERQRVAELEARLTKIRTQFCEVHQPEDDEGKTCSSPPKSCS